MRWEYMVEVGMEKNNVSEIWGRLTVMDEQGDIGIGDNARRLP